jgi:cytochrome c
MSRPFLTAAVVAAVLAGGCAALHAAQSGDPGARPDRPGPSAGAPATPAPVPAGNADRGAPLFRQCAACHSLQPRQHFTGPSLAGFWGRKAGTIDGFVRYSEALKKSGLVWTEATLDRWMADPAAMVRGNFMTFRGIEEPAHRADLIAYLREVASGRRRPGVEAEVPSSHPRLDLKAIAREYRVRAVRYCGDAYFVTTETGDIYPYWEFNLRLKTDGSALGPAQGSPVLLPAGMQGDRAYLVFAGPEDISARIERRCP